MARPKSADKAQAELESRNAMIAEITNAVLLAMKGNAVSTPNSVPEVEDDETPQITPPKRATQKVTKVPTGQTSAMNFKQAMEYARTLLSKEPGTLVGFYKGKSKAGNDCIVARIKLQSGHEIDCKMAPWHFVSQFGDLAK